MIRWPRQWQLRGSKFQQHTSDSWNWRELEISPAWSRNISAMLKVGYKYISLQWQSFTDTVLCKNGWIKQNTHMLFSWAQGSLWWRSCQFSPCHSAARKPETAELHWLLHGRCTTMNHGDDTHNENFGIRNDGKLSTDRLLDLYGYVCEIYMQVSKN